MFLLFDDLIRRRDDTAYQDLLRAGPFGLGQTGYVLAILVLSLPLIAAILVLAITGQPGPGPPAGP